MTKVIPILAKNYNDFVESIKDRNERLGNYAFIFHKDNLNNYKGILYLTDEWRHNDNYNDDFVKHLLRLNQSSRVTIVNFKYKDYDLDKIIHI